MHAPFDLGGVWARRQSLDVAGRMALANLFSPGEGDTRWLRLPRPLYPLVRLLRLALSRLAGCRP